MGDVKIDRRRDITESRCWEFNVFGIFSYHLFVLSSYCFCPMFFDISEEKAKKCKQIDQTVDKEGQGTTTWHNPCVHGPQ